MKDKKIVKQEGNKRKVLGWKNEKKEDVSNDDDIGDTHDPDQNSCDALQRISSDSEDKENNTGQVSSDSEDKENNTEETGREEKVTRKEQRNEGVEPLDAITAPTDKAETKPNDHAEPKIQVTTADAKELPASLPTSSKEVSISSSNKHVAVVEVVLEQSSQQEVNEAGENLKRKRMDQIAETAKLLDSAKEIKDIEVGAKGDVMSIENGKGQNVFVKEEPKDGLEVSAVYTASPVPLPLCNIEEVLVNKNTTLVKVSESNDQSIEQVANEDEKKIEENVIVRGKQTENPFLGSFKIQDVGDEGEPAVVVPTIPFGKDIREAESVEEEELKDILDVLATLAEPEGNEGEDDTNEGVKYTSNTGGNLILPVVVTKIDVEPSPVI